MRIVKEALSFDDILLVPQRFKGNSRKDVDISTHLFDLKFNVPIISANMPSISEQRTCLAMWKSGGLGIYHRMEEAQDCEIMDLKKMNHNIVVGGSVGIDSFALEKTRNLIEYGADVVCVEVAHAHQDKLLDVVSKLTKEFYDTNFIIGNIATREAGVDIIRACDKRANVALKCGVGGGSVCLTRVQTGAGCPTLQSVIDCADLGVPIIADGGIKTSGDIVKSLACGASMVMVGSLLAGCTETPGSVIKDSSGNKFKVYRGSASYGTKKDLTKNTDFVEGAETLVKFKGPVSEVIKKLSDGIRSGFSYGGALNLEELQRKSKFVKVTSSGYKEGLPHALLT